MSEKFLGLWYDRPASCWVEALPLGNGRLGAMVYGGLQKETISINEETCWEGADIDRSNPKAFEKLGPQVKALLDVEMNILGQMTDDVILASGNKLPVEFYGEYWRVIDEKKIVAIAKDLLAKY